MSPLQGSECGATYDARIILETINYKRGLGPLNPDCYLILLLTSRSKNVEGKLSLKGRSS